MYYGKMKGFSVILGAYIGGNQATFKMEFSQYLDPFLGIML
jgi:hypothetical protein